MNLLFGYCYLPPGPVILLLILRALNGVNVRLYQYQPNKSLEGYVGGFIGCLLTGIIYAVIVGIPFFLGLGAGLLTGIAAPLGDLFESKLKRACGVKDSGVLLPGHGGVLDRFDSLLFSAPMVLVYLL